MAGTPIQVDLTNETSPDWTAQGAITPPAQPQTCAICLQDIDTAAVGPDVSFEWPTCRHPIHLQCAIQHVSHQGRPACPTCRQPWTREGGLAMEQARSMLQVPWMVPETPYDTRTHHVEAPPAPDLVIPLCCPRLVLIDHEHPEHDTSWPELPARHMEWAPTFDQTTQQWQTDTSDSPGDTTSSTSTASTSSTSTSHAATPSPPQRTSTAPHPAPQTRPEQLGADDQTHHQRHRAAFQSLDEIDLQETLMKKFIGFQSPPTFLKGRIRQAMQFALEAILQATTADQTLRSWKLWLLLPRMLPQRFPNQIGASA